ncbi:MAG TPA: twin-arginine translocase TatA/TatE family subunit [Thermodesulfobacteriota bacterium]|jgi:sec-independent protein translocase protein TatA|nr:twin-arginine translocase TatA/TatE family subunit [Thermodesulfobacteriota bacterium]
MLAGPDLLVILVIALVIFGGNRIADLGAGLGKGIRSFKEGLQEKDTKTALKGSEDTSQKRKE